ncbi:hypothetical protein UVUMRFZT_CDS0050 [Staphylococcus phage LJLAME001]
MPHLKAYDKYGNILAIGYNVELHEEVGSVIIPNLAPHTHYPQGEFYVSWEAEKYETDKVVVPGFTTLESSFKEITLYFKDHILVNAKSAYDVAVDNGFVGSEEEWVKSIKGEKGEEGEQGKQGLSAYEVAVNNGFTGSATDWLKTGKSPYVYSNEYIKQKDDTSDVQRLRRAIKDTSEGNTLHIPSSESPIKIDDTLIIDKNINIVSDAKIVYNGSKDKPAIKLDSLSYSNVTIKGIYDDSSYPTYGGGYHGFKSQNYIGLELVNCRNVNTNINEIIGFTVGNKHKATGGKGHWFNNTIINFFINNETHIELNTDGIGSNGEQSWMNSNYFYKSAFSYSGTEFNKHPNTYYNIKQTLTNANTYGGNSNVFDSLKFETASTTSENYVMVYLKKAVGFIFKNYRFEFNNKATFAIIDLETQDMTKSYVTHSKDIKFIPEFVLGNGHKLTFTNINTAKIPRSSIAKIVDEYKTTLLYKNNDFSKDYRRLGGNYHTVKNVFRKPLQSTSLTDEVSYDYSTTPSLVNDKGLLTFTGSYPMALYVNNVSVGDELIINKLSFIGNSSGIFIKCFDKDGNILDKVSNNYDTILLDGYYNDKYKAFTFNNAQKDAFTVNSEDVKSIVILISGTMQGLLVDSTNPSNIIKSSNDSSKNKTDVFYSHVKPSSVEDFKYDEKVYNNGTTQVYGWVLKGNDWKELGKDTNSKSKVIVNIEDYPRINDEDNDYPRFQRALDYLTSTKGGTLIVPKGTEDYLFKTKTPTVQNPSRVKVTGSNIHIKGEGNPTFIMSGITKNYLDSIDDISSSGRDMFTGFSFINCDNILVEGLTFKGEWDSKGEFRYASPRSIGVAFKGSRNCKAYNVHGYNIMGNVVNAVNTMQAVDGVYGYSDNITIDSCSATQCLENGFNFMGGTKNGYYVNNISTGNGSSGFESGTENVIISNNIHTNNKYSGLSISGTNYTITNNVIYGNSNKGELSNKPSNGIAITGGSKGVISNNNVSGNEGYELYLYPGVNNIDIQNNVLKQDTTSLKTSIIYASGTTSKPVSEINFKNNTLRSTNTALDKAMFLNFVMDSTITNNDIKTDKGNDSLSVQGSCSNLFVLNNNMNKNLSISSNAFNVISKDNIAYNLPKVLNGTAIPTTGSWRLGDIIVNTSRTLTSGSPEKWRCTSDGVATNMKWTSNTDYTQGQIVYNGNYVYKAVASGTSGGTQPTHNNGVISDGSILWEFISTKANFEVISQIGVTESISNIPLYKGQIAIIGSSVYVAKGTSSNTDWIILN